MQPIPISFEKKGFQFKQVTRDGAWAIYKRWKTVSDGDTFHYEVIAIQHHNGRTFPDGVYEAPKEFYPSAEQWGTKGFTFQDKELAFDKLKSMTTQNENQTTAATPAKGPKAAFAFPVGEFKVSELAKKLNISAPLLHLRMKAAGNRIREVRKEKAAGKGRAAGIYIYE